MESKEPTVLRGIQTTIFPRELVTQKLRVKNNIKTTFKIGSYKFYKTRYRAGFGVVLQENTSSFFTLN
jgi:hypothetical protein